MTIRLNVLQNFTIPKYLYVSLFHTMKIISPSIGVPRHDYWQS